jgi:hypothetical protein
MAPNIESVDVDGLIFMYDEIFLPQKMQVGKYACPSWIIKKFERENPGILKPERVKFTEPERAHLLADQARPKFQAYMRRYYEEHVPVIEEDMLRIQATPSADVAQDLCIIYRVATLAEPVTIISGFEGNRLIPIEWNYKGETIKSVAKRHKGQVSDSFFAFFSEAISHLIDWMEPKIVIFFVEKGALDRKQVLAKNRHRQLKGTWSTRVILFILILVAFEICLTSLLGTSIMPRLSTFGFFKKNFLGGIVSLAMTTGIYGFLLFILWLTHNWLIGLSCLIFSVLGWLSTWALLRYY